MQETTEEILDLFRDMDQDEEFCIQVVSQYYGTLPLVKEPTYEIYKAAVVADGCNIAYIKNPTEELCALAVTNCPEAVQYIDNPSEEVCMIVANHRLTGCVRLIDNPSEEVMRTAVYNDAYSIINMKNPPIDLIYYAIDTCPELVLKIDATEEMIIRAAHNGLKTLEGCIWTYTQALVWELVAIDPIFVRFLDDPPEDICLQVIQNRPHFVLFINKPTDAMMRLAVEQGSSAFNLLLDLSEEMMWYILSLDYKQIRNFRNPTVEMVEHVLAKHDYLPPLYTPELCEKIFAISPKHFPSCMRQTEEMCLAAVHYDASFLRWCNIRTPEIILTAIRKEPRTILFVSNPSFEACLEAVSLLPSLLPRLKKKYPILCTRLGFPEPNVTEEDMLSQVSQNPQSILELSDPSDVIWAKAISLDPTLIFRYCGGNEELILETLIRNPMLIGQYSPKPKTYCKLAERAPHLKELIAEKIDNIILKRFVLKN